MHFCVQCKIQLSNPVSRYCSNKCQNDYRYHEYIIRWQSGEVDGNRGVHVRNISRHLRRYLFEKYNTACVLCGWAEHNEITGEVPLEIDHIDGNAENNQESNLRLLCPNCHSLTPNFRNLNNGLGRQWRRQNYKKVNAALAQR